MRLVVVIPTRNRAELAINALRSVLAENAPEVRVAVSDNSTAPEQVEKLSRLVTGLGSDRVRYMRPPQSLGMTDHWLWALQQVRGEGEPTHFSFLTDRMVFRPGTVRRLVELAACAPDRVISYNHDLVDDHRVPVRLHEFRWTGRTVEVDSVYLLSLASRSQHPPCNPRFLNALVPEAVIAAVEGKFGSTFGSISPDFCFAYRCLDVVDSILYWDRSPLVNYAYDRSNGAAYLRGVSSQDSADFEGQLGDKSMNNASPVPEFRTITNAVMNEYCFVRAESGSAKFPPVEMKSYLEAMAIDLESIEDPALIVAQRELLVRQGGEPVPRGSARLLRRLQSAGPARLIRRLAMRVFANSLTQPAWAAAGSLGVTPPPSPRFGFRSASEAIAWTFRFARRPSRQLRRLDWQRDTVHVREVDMPPSPDGPKPLEAARCL